MINRLLSVLINWVSKREQAAIYRTAERLVFIPSISFVGQTAHKQSLQLLGDQSIYCSSHSPTVWSDAFTSPDTLLSQVGQE